MLLKKMYEKVVSENTTIGKSTKEQTIATFPKYAVLHNKKLYEIKKISNIPGILDDKKIELEIIFVPIS